MSNRKNALGFRDVIHLAWMEKTLNLMFAGLNPEEVRRNLHDYLERESINRIVLNRKRDRNIRKFAVDILMRIWVNVPEDCVALRNKALDLIRRDPAAHIVFIWGLLGDNYPFWFDVAEQTGKHLQRHVTASISKLKNDMSEKYGDRALVHRNPRNVIRSFLAWDLLFQTFPLGDYRQGKIVKITDLQILTWLEESMLISSDNRSMTLKSLSTAPVIFPFKIEPN